MTGVRVVHHRLDAPRWTSPRTLRIAVLADLHACTRWMPAPAVQALVDRINALSPDLVLLPGDFAGHAWFSRPLPAQEVAGILSGLRAPLGVHAVPGNHDWKDDPTARRARLHRTVWHDALEAAGIPVLANTHRILHHGPAVFALAGIDSQRAYGRGRRVGRGAHDVEKALDGVPAGMFTMMMAHEPDIFPGLDPRVDLTISGHTHGGQIRLFGRPWVVPSDHGRSYAYGLYRRGHQALVVSGGVGLSGPPVRVGMPPEIVLVALS